VGCDLKIGSIKQIDECGVCGGDGSSCSKPLYHWILSYTSLCSATCGREKFYTFPSFLGGIRESGGPCSASCGDGIKVREVYCAEEVNNTKMRVEDTKCGSERPLSQEVCSNIDCHTWTTTKWSGCSVSCGEGVQIRKVDCKSLSGEPSSLCSTDSKPATKKSCSTGIQCAPDFDITEKVTEQLYRPQRLVQLYPPPPFIPDEWGPCSVSCGEGIRKREVHCKIFLEFSRTIAKLPDIQCSGKKPLEVETSDIKVAPGSPAKSYSWKEQGYTHCSATCLGGVQELIVNCVRDDTQKVTSPYMCPIELKPEVLMRTCNDHPCPLDGIIQIFLHALRAAVLEYKLGKLTVSMKLPKIDNIATCWIVQLGGKCMNGPDVQKAVGVAKKTRKVECKQIMAQNHSVDRPPSMCPSPKPPDTKPCNTKSCIVESDKPHIDVSNSTFIQHDPKKKKISLKVGGAATVFFGTTIKIKCPKQNQANFQHPRKSKKHIFKPHNVDQASDVSVSDRNPIFNDDHSHEQKPNAMKKKPAFKPKLFTPTLPSLKLDANLYETTDPNHVRFPRTVGCGGRNRHGASGAELTVGRRIRSRRWSPSVVKCIHSCFLYSFNAAKDPVPQSPSSSDYLEPPIYEDTTNSAARIVPNFQRLIFNLQVRHL
ncbi:hypothetical protein NQ317_003038, partial [Molorchus minor]